MLDIHDFRLAFNSLSCFTCIGICRLSLFSVLFRTHPIYWTSFIRSHFVAVRPIERTNANGLRVLVFLFVFFVVVLFGLFLALRFVLFCFVWFFFLACLVCFVLVLFGAVVSIDSSHLFTLFASCTPTGSAVLCFVCRFVFYLVFFAYFLDSRHLRLCVGATFKAHESQKTTG